MTRTKGDPAGPLLVVVNGPIGGGKSTVAGMLRERGAHVIDADHLGHLVLEPGAEAHGAVATAWPEVVVDGAIDRRRLAGIVFADPDELASLERLTHPHIAARIRDAVVAALDAATPPPVVVLEIPLLSPPEGSTAPGGGGSGGWHTLTVLADDDVRRDRAVARGMDPDDAGRRIRAQPPAEDWEAVADTVIRNDGDLGDLRRRVEEWWVRHGA